MDIKPDSTIHNRKNDQKRDRRLISEQAQSGGRLKYKLKCPTKTLRDFMTDKRNQYNPRLIPHTLGEWPGVLGTDKAK